MEAEIRGIKFPGKNNETDEKIVEIVSRIEEKINDSLKLINHRFLIGDIVIKMISDIIGSDIDKLKDRIKTRKKDINAVIRNNRKLREQLEISTEKLAKKEKIYKILDVIYQQRKKISNDRDFANSVKVLLSVLEDMSIGNLDKQLNRLKLEKESKTII